MSSNDSNREKLSSRMGFLLLSAGCAIGLGNVWRFPFITGMYGGAIFVLIYLVCLVLLGIPIMTMEFAVGRSAGLSAAKSFHALQKSGSKWHSFSYPAMFGNYLLMFFYTTVSGWMLAYLFKTAEGAFVGLTKEQVEVVFGTFVSNPGSVVIWMVAAVAIGFAVCSGGLAASVEKVGKFMMIGLFVVVGILAVRSMTLPGAGAGIAFLLKPNLSAFQVHGFGTIVFAALGQAFFTLSLGIGSMAIFGSYINKDRALFGEAITVTAIDFSAAILAGLVIFPACFAYGVAPDAGPPLIFITLPNIFNSMPIGQLWGTLFFVFMSFAAMSTVIAVFENLIAFVMELTGFSRGKACLINFAIVVIFSLPCALGFNLLSGFNVMGGVLDLEDFILSNNILPLGALVYCLFCVYRSGWGWDNFIKEANTGKGLKFPTALKPYFAFVIPVIIIVIFAMGYINIFGK